MIHRFFVSDPLEKGLVLLQGPEFKHLKVMKSSSQNEITLINGKGQIAKAEIEKIERDHAKLLVTSVSIEKEKPEKKILALALTKQNHLEMAIEKACEIGIDAFWIFPSELSEKKSFREDRLQKILIGSIKQCGRLYLPEISFFSSLSNLPTFSGFVFFGDVRENALYHSQVKGDVLVFIGPEKGFSKKEVSSLEKYGKGIRLSNHVLRTETAAICAAYWACSL